MVRYKQEFNPVDLKDYQQQYKRAKIAYLESRLYRRLVSLITRNGSQTVTSTQPVT
jgi:hypothetical protein